MLDKIGHKTKIVIRDKEGYFIIIKGQLERYNNYMAGRGGSGL